MTFQIRTIAIYSETGEIREVKLNPGSLNIITGASKTGKSTLLDIVDYCMGSSGFPIAAGVVRTHARAFAVLFQGGQEGVFVARFAPDPGKSVSTQFHVRSMSPDGSLPMLEELTVTSDRETAKSELAAFAGIRANLHEPESGTRRSLRATIRHSLFYCLQGQDETASRSVLFHSQAGEHRPQAMRDVMPYFLGAVPDDHIAKINRIRLLRRDLKQLRQAEAERDNIRGPSGREQSLIAESIRVGLVDEFDDSVTSPIEFLTQAMNAPEPAVDLPGPSSFTDLTTRRQDLRDEFSRVRASLENLQIIANERSEFAAEADEQRSRVSLAEIFGTANQTTCPVCTTDLVERTDTVDELISELSILEQDIASISTTTPELDLLIANAEEELARLETSLRENQIALNEAELSNRLLAEYREEALQRAAVRGRISLFLSAQPEAIVEEAIYARIEELEAEIQTLDAELGSDETAHRLESALSRVNSNITEIAKALQLEHSESPARLDIRRLTVIADTLEGPVSLDQMGSGENWVGYHLATMLGLHRYFVEAGRPVPRFLAIDQPSQVYFPPDVDDPDLDNDEDREALERMMGAANSEVERHSGNLQILVVDHADLAVDWFQESVIERWRGGAALVPEHWIEDGHF